MAELYEFIKAVGVPAAIALYVLVRIDRTIREQSKVLFELGIAIARLEATIRQNFEDR